MTLLKDLIDESPISTPQIVVVAICFVLNVLDGFDVVAISYAAPAIAEDWRIAPTTLGVVFSAGLVGMTVGAMFLAPFTDVIGRRKMILYALIIISASMTITGMAENTAHLIVLRIITGLGIGAMLASLTSMVAEYTPKRRRNFAIGFLQTGYPVGATVGGFLAAWLVPVYGWRELFFVGGGLTAIMAPIVLLWLPESLDFLATRQPPHALQKINKMLHRMQRPALRALPEKPSGRRAAVTIGALLTPDFRANTLKLWLAFFMCFFTLYFLLSWIPKIIVNAGFSLENGISAGIAFNAGAVIGVLALGYLADKRGLKGLIALFLVVGGALMLGFGLAPADLIALLCLAFLIGAFVDGGFAGLYSVAARLYPTEIRTTGVGWAIGAGRFGGVAGPYVGGLVIAWQWSSFAAFALFAAPMMIAAAAVIAIRSAELASTETGRTPSWR